MINYLYHITDYNWRGNAYQWFFYVGIALTIVFERRISLKTVFGWVPICCLAIIYNPLCSKLLNIAGLFGDGYQARLFSFVPLMYVITRGFSFFILTPKINDNQWMKLLCVVVICGVICYTGHNVYKETWLTKANNYAKVPMDTIDIIEAIEDRDDVCIASIDEATVYLRQIEDVITPYGRYVGDLGQILTQDPPDVVSAMETAGKQDVDYIVVHKTDATIAAFDDNGYKPYRIIKNYVIYKVENVPRIRRVVDKNRKVIAQTRFDSEGNKLEGEKGEVTVIYEYDMFQNKIKESYLDHFGNAYQCPDGYSTIHKTYYANGLLKTISYTDLEGKRIIIDGRFETKYKYNKSGHVVGEIYYDTRGQIIDEVDEDKPVKTSCLEYIHKTDGARRDEKGNVLFVTKVSRNCFNAVWFQLFDASTGEHLIDFGGTDEPAEIFGEYTHKLPSGLYKLHFKGNTNLADESISSLEYLNEGETLYYHYSVDEMKEQSVKISNLYIGRKKIEGNSND